ncbi:MAG: thioredoxin family protein [Rhodospirillales bacterium]
MANQRQVDIYSAGCAICDDAVELVRKIACSSCSISVRDMNDLDVARRARELGITAVPAIVIDGKLADCCSSGGPNEDTLRAAGIGTPLA